MINSFDFYKKKTKKENKEEKPFLKFLFSILVKSLIVIVLFLGSLIFIRQSDENKKNFENIVFNNSLSFAKIYSIYNKYLGDALPFKNTFKETTKVVSNEKITYSNIEKENNGYMLSVSSDFIVSSVKSGIVIEKKKNEEYGNIIKIQDKSTSTSSRHP